MITKNHMKIIFKKMLEIRSFELAAIRTYKQRLWKGSLHQCISQEAVPAVSSVFAKKTDYFVSNHRGHGHTLAKGVEPQIFMAELFGRMGGLCFGRGGSMHMMDQDKRVYPNGLVGSCAYVSAGIGLAIKYKRNKDIVFCFLGDGAINAGGFMEGLNMAATWKLPVIFICENNGIGVSTEIKDTVAIPNLSQRALGFGITGMTVDGTDVLELYKVMDKGIKHVREGNGPIFIEALSRRYIGHTAWDTGFYRTDEENNKWKYYDPIKRLGDYMTGEGFYTQEELESWKQEADALIEGAVEFAKNSAHPPYTREEAIKFVYTD